MSNLTTFEKKHYVIKELGSGSYGITYACIPRSIAVEIVSDLKAQSSTNKPLAVSAARSRLRASLEAVKISKPGKGFHGKLDLCSEIKTLKSLNKGTSPNIVRLKESDSESNTWLTLELLNGSDLSHFISFLENSHQGKSLPSNFAWHMLFQLAEALLMLHFGYQEGKDSIPDWQKFAHTDVSGRNIMFRTNTTTASSSLSLLGGNFFRDYPDLVLIDFGSAEKVNAKATEGIIRYPVNFRGVDHQALDLKEGINAIERVFGQLLSSDEKLWETLMEFSRWGADEDDAKADESLFEKLLELREKALGVREECYEPLSCEIVEYLEKCAEVISDEELEKAFPELG